VVNADEVRRSRPAVVPLLHQYQEIGDQTEIQKTHRPIRGSAMTASHPESRSLLVEGAAIEYSDREGEGDPILLIHGGVFGAWWDTHRYPAEVAYAAPSR
jgi:hypothetical protein